MKTTTKLTALASFALMGASQAAITVQQHYTFNDNTTPGGLTVQAGTASYSGGELVMNNSTWLAGSSGIGAAVTTDYGFEVIATASAFEAFDFAATLTTDTSGTINRGVGLLAQGNWLGLVSGVGAFGTTASATGAEVRLAFVRTGTTNTIYVNGVAAGSNTAAPIGTVETLSIGGHPFDADGGAGIWNGTINEVRTFTFNTGEFVAGDLLTAATVPEPSSTALLGLGGLALILRRRK